MLSALAVSRSRVACIVAVALLISTASASGQQPPPPGTPPGKAGAKAPIKAPPKDTLSVAERDQLRETQRDARSLVRKRLSGDSATKRARADSATASAFGSTEARAILERARDARERQDSALKSYRATTTQRMSLSMGVRKVGLEKLLFRGDNVSQISWKRGVGVWVTPIGSRMVVPMADEVDGDMVSAVSIPYFPGRESLWMPSSSFGMVKTDVDERDMIHPLARGAEYYYRYETGDSVDIKIEGGRVIRIRELRITARRPDWKLFVGSFWFDRDGGQLVRAAYRMAVDFDIWDVASKENSLSVQENKETLVVRDSIARDRLPRDLYVKDSSSRARLAEARARNNKNANDDDVPAWVSATMRPAKAKLDGITVEYGLYQGRFWLPRMNSATASAEFGFMRAPFTMEEKFSYEDVNGDFFLAPVPQPQTPAARALVAAAIAKAAGDSVARDSIRRLNPTDSENRGVRISTEVGTGKGSAAARRASADSGRIARGDTGIMRRLSTSQRAQCSKDSVYTRMESRYEGALRIAYAMPCDPAKLTTSAALPAAYASDEDLFDIKSRDELLASLDMGLQPAFAPQMPTIRTGADLWRYNRVEGLSIGVLATETLGAGYTLSAVGRIGHADLHVNGELSLARSNSVRTVTATIFHRLVASNPEWGGALTLGPSLPALLYGRDEGFYYRAFGAELGEKREQRHGSLEYKLFVEHEWTAADSNVVNTFSFGKLLANNRFQRNILSEPVSLTGVNAAWLHAFGNDPQGFRLTTTARMEAATGTFEYARGSLDGTVTRPIGRIAAALTGGIGSSIGRLPVQKLWYMGGLRTVRGEVPGTQSGDAYWLTRAEVGTRSGAFRPVMFFDVGWAGKRDLFGKIQPQRGAGIGMGFLDGLFRIDLSRGLYPGKRWRTDIYLEAPL